MAPDPFDDVLAANAAYAEHHDLGGLEARAARHLCVLTCMDSRIDPLSVLGLKPGDAKVLRNAGARVTEEVLTALVVARHLLDVDRLMVVGHTRCAMSSGPEASIHAAIAARGGPDTRSLRLLTAEDQEAALRADAERVRASPYLEGLTVGTFLLDLDTGRLRAIV